LFLIFLGAGHTLKIIRQPFSVLAHPADLPGRVAHYQSMIRNIFIDYRTGAHKGLPADGGAADNGAVGPKGGTLSDPGGPDLIHLHNFRSGIIDIGEHH
jgi:hypothetical protein